MDDIEAIVISRETVASPALTWRAGTEPEIVMQWFTDATPATGVGAPYRLDFGDSEVVGVVTVLDPPRTLGHTWAWKGHVPVQETRVTWTVEPAEGGGSRVTLTHDGWAAAGAAASTRDDHAEHWEDYLDRLAELLDTE